VKKERTVLFNINAYPLLRKLLALLMIFSLLLLTAANFFYSSDGESAIYSLSESDAPIQGPVEEKSGNSGFSLLEEMMHDTDNNFGIKSFDALKEYMTDKAKELLYVHFELISPPPEQIS